MPRGDGTGPQGQGPQTGRGVGKCGPEGGTAASQRQGGKGKGRGSGQGAGRGQGKGRGTGQGRGRQS